MHAIKWFLISLLLGTSIMQGMDYVIYLQCRSYHQQFSSSSWKENTFCATEKEYGMAFGRIWWSKPPTWNLAKVLVESLDRQQSQERCKSGPKANTHAVKYSNPWIPSEKKTKAQLQTTKKKQWVGWKQMKLTKLNYKTFFKHASILFKIQIIQKMHFVIFILVKWLVLKST